MFSPIKRAYIPNSISIREFVRLLNSQYCLFGLTLLYYLFTFCCFMFASLCCCCCVGLILVVDIQKVGRKIGVMSRA